MNGSVKKWDAENINIWMWFFSGALIVIGLIVLLIGTFVNSDVLVVVGACLQLTIMLYVFLKGRSNIGDTCNAVDAPKCDALSANRKQPDPVSHSFKLH